MFAKYKNHHFLPIGSNEGIWQVGIKDMLPKSKLANFPTTTLCASTGYVAAGDEQGAIILFQNGSDSWSQTQRAQEQETSCCTSMLILQERGQHGRCRQRYEMKMQSYRFLII